MPRISSLLTLTALLALGGCGTSGSDSTFASGVGPAELALPVFDDGTNKTLALRDFSGSGAPMTVAVTAVPGGPQPPFSLAGSPFTVPARGELRLGVPLVEGWLLIETSGPSTGLVEPYLLTERSGPDEEATQAAVFARTQSAIPIHRLTDTVLFLNHSENGGVPTAVDFVFTFHGTDGSSTPILPTGPGVLPGPSPDSVNIEGDTSVTLPPLPGSVGHVSVEPLPFVPAPPPNQTAPLTTEFAFTLSTHDDNDIVLDVDDQRRLLDGGVVSIADLILDFGKDAEDNYHDFDIVASNVSDAPASFTIQAIYDAGGNAILLTPRTVNLLARQTRLYASNLSESVGLVNPEVHPFADLFGGVFSATGLTRFRMALSISAGVFLTARQFDPLALDFAMRVRPIARHQTTSVLISEAQTTTAGGILNIIQISNPTGGTMTVNLRAFTETRGTEYVLPSVMVPPFATIEWSADALGLREIVDDLASPEVRNLRIVLISNIAFMVRPYQKTRNGADLLVMLRPHTIRGDN